MTMDFAQQELGRVLPFRLDFRSEGKVTMNAEIAGALIQGIEKLNDARHRMVDAMAAAMGGAGKDWGELMAEPIIAAAIAHITAVASDEAAFDKTIHTHSDSALRYVPLFVDQVIAVVTQFPGQQNAAHK